MKKLSLLILWFLSTSTFAGYFKQGDLWYYFNNASSTTVSVASDQTNANYSGLKTVVIPDSVENNEKKYAVTGINKEAFYGCSALEEVTLPAGLTSIGESAFRGCSAMSSIIVPNAVTSLGASAFRDCSALTSVVLGSSVAGFGEYAFYGCSLLESINIPESVTYIHSNAFEYCKSLTSFIVPKNVTDIRSYAFRNTGITSVIWQAKNYTKVSDASPFSDIAGQITSFVIGENVEHIPAYLCYQIKTIPSIEIPNSVKSIGQNAFNSVGLIYVNTPIPPVLENANVVNEDALIVVPDALLDIYKSADVWSRLEKQIVCTSDLTQRQVGFQAHPAQSALHQALGEANLMRTVSLKVTGTINSYDIMLIRNKMRNLRYLDLSGAEVVANEYEYYAGYCSHDNKLENYAFSELNIRVVHLPKGLVEIHDCFTGCPYLDTVYCQSGLQTIGNMTFDNCPSLRHVELKEGLVTIGQNAFSETRNLHAIALPASLETIGDGAFYNTGLQSLTIPANVSSIGQGAFVSDNKVYSTYSNAGHFGTWYAGKYESSQCGGGTIEEVKMEAGAKLQSIPAYAFVGQEELRTIDWENTHINSIDRAAFAFCKSLKIPQLPTNLNTIKEYAFEECSAIDVVACSPRLATIEGYAFQNCSHVNMIRISSSVRRIDNYAFAGCSGVASVYAYPVEPVNILKQTFSCWNAATLYVPSTSYDKYYYNTQWNEFNIVVFDEDYDYFYLNGDYPLGGDNGEITGEPDVDLYPGSGLIIEGNKMLQKGNIHYISDTDAYPSIIADGNLSMDTLRVVFPQHQGVWHFLTFPFDIKRQDIECNGEFVVRYYDGAIRAEHGSGGWQNVPADDLYNGQGYIFQTADNDTLVLEFASPILPNEDVSLPLHLYDAANAWDANWNMVGNPYMAYYDMDSIQNFFYPIIAWNGTGYDTYRPGDDVYHFKPLEGFFIQNANLTEVTLPISGRETRTEANTKLADSHSSRKIMAAAHAEKQERKLINLTLSSATYTDRTRVVFNANAGMGYEIGVDANKFISTSAPVQLYSLGKSKEQYSINERPETRAGETIQLGYYAATAGNLTLSASRMDTAIVIYDNVTNQYVDLSEGDYMFYSEAGYNHTRFAMSAAKAPSVETGVDEIRKDDWNNVVVYSITGQLLAENVHLSTLDLPAGVYMIQTESATHKIVIP